MNQTLIVPDWLIAQEQEAKEIDRLLSSQWFLVRISGNGEVWRCSRCGCKHDFLTRFCVSRPWNGLTRGLWAYYKTVGAHGVEPFLPPAERARIANLGRMFGSLATAPDAATGHAQMARMLSTGERDVNIGAQALGVLEPITEAEARRFATLINARANHTVIRIPTSVAAGR